MLTLGYERWGEGAQPLVMLHGFTGNRQAFDHLKPLLSPHFSVVTVDLPGHGASPLPLDAAEDGFEQTVGALTRLLDNLKLSWVHVAGYSQGARVALAWAFSQPHRFSALALESVSPGISRRRRRAVRRQGDEQLAHLLENKGLEKFIERWEKLPLLKGLLQISKPLREQLKALRLTSSPGGLAGALRCLGVGVQENFWPRLPQLRIPTLILTGQNDGKYSQIAQRMAQELPRGCGHVVPDCGHTPHLEAPEAFCAELISFFNNVGCESLPADTLGDFLEA